MKTLKILILVSFLLLSFSAYAENKFIKEDKGDVEQVITSFVKNVDSRNADELSKTVLPTASIVTINDLTKNLDNFSASQFVNLVKNGQKGGWQRNVHVSSVEFDGNTAVAQVAITDSRLKESGYFTLVKDNGSWKIAGQVTTLQLNK
ncbi:MAG: nuclear transport factor 2 family protein [Bacteroidetes bacterium]|nr:nuclear transport factor 2 family protein [Bacteroidota bacterium]